MHSCHHEQPWQVLSWFSHRLPMRSAASVRTAPGHQSAEPHGRPPVGHPESWRVGELLRGLRSCRTLGRLPCREGPGVRSQHRGPHHCRLSSCARATWSAPHGGSATGPEGLPLLDPQRKGCRPRGRTGFPAPSVGSVLQVRLWR